MTHRFMAFDRDKFCILSFDLKNIWSLTFGWIGDIMSFFFYSFRSNAPDSEVQRHWCQFVTDYFPMESFNERMTLPKYKKKLLDETSEINSGFMKNSNSMAFYNQMSMRIGMSWWKNTAINNWWFSRSKSQCTRHIYFNLDRRRHRLIPNISQFA